MRYLYLWFLLCLLGSSCSKDVKVSQSDIIGGASHATFMTVKSSDKSSSKPTVDIDLTTMKKTMVYATVNDMMMHPDKYMGKTMKMSGLHDRSYDYQTGKYYHYVVIEDATACCQQGMEFVLPEQYKEEDYPKLNTKIDVVGVFDSYDEDGVSYFYIEAERVGN